jgi:site-specific DNA recombinase
MTPTHTRRNGRLYRYYVSMDVLKDGANACPIRRLPAGDVENAVLSELRVLLRAPEIIVQTWRAARKVDRAVTEAEVRDALERFDHLWGELFPAEQARIVQLLVERVEVGHAGLDIHLRTEGLATLIGDLRAAIGDTRRAA